MDLFEYKLDDMIEGPTLGGAATYIESSEVRHQSLHLSEPAAAGARINSRTGQENSHG